MVPGSTLPKHGPGGSRKRLPAQEEEEQEQEQEKLANAVERKDTARRSAG